MIGIQAMSLEGNTSEEVMVTNFSPAIRELAQSDDDMTEALGDWSAGAHFRGQIYLIVSRFTCL